MTSLPSLQDLLDSSSHPALVLDLRLQPYHGEDASVVKNIKVSHNSACESSEFQNAFESFVSQKLEPRYTNPRRQNGSWLEAGRRVIGEDIWLGSTIGSYKIWNLRPGNGSQGDAFCNNCSIKDQGMDGKNKDLGSGENERQEEISREQQLYNRLDNIDGTLKTFRNLANQTLRDLETAIKELSSPSSTEESRSIRSSLHPIELNLRTLSSGLSLLSSLSSVSSFEPPKPPPSSQVPLPPPPSDTALLSKFRSCLLPPQSRSEKHPTTKNHTPFPHVQPYIPTLRVLVIEDNRVNQRVFQKFLQKVGILPEFLVQAYNGVEGLEALESLERVGSWPDIIMVDACMPVMSGFGFLDEYNKRWPGSRARVLGLMVAGGGVDTKLRNLGAVDFIMKPMRFSDIRDQVEKAAAVKIARDVEFRGKL